MEITKDKSEKQDKDVYTLCRYYSLYIFITNVYKFETRNPS